MAINYSTAVKNARLQAVADAVGTAGVIVIGTSALAGAATGVLASVPMANPPFTIANGVMTLASAPRTVNASATGTAAKAELRSSAGTVVASGLTVGVAGSGADVIINAVAVSSGQTVQVSSGVINHAV